MQRPAFRQIPAADGAIGVAGHQHAAVWIEGHAAGGDIAFTLEHPQALASGVAQTGDPGAKHCKTAPYCGCLQGDISGGGIRLYR